MMSNRSNVGVYEKDGVEGLAEYRNGGLIVEAKGPGYEVHAIVRAKALGLEPFSGMDNNTAERIILSEIARALR